jgi:hypothetical protein
MIDFAKSGNVSSPIAWDAATLDVALAFDGWGDDSTTVAVEEVELLYASQIFGVDAAKLSRRAALSVRVRDRAKADCTEDSEYAIALAAALMRTARLLATSKGPEEKRAMLIETALRCANCLIATLP